MPPRKKVADEPDALPGVMEAARRRRRRRRSRRRRSRSRRRRSGSRSRSRSLSQPQEMAGQSRSPSASSRSSSACSPSPVRRKARSTKFGNVNPFINFVSSERARMGGTNRPASEVTRELGARWRAMPMEERQPYIAQAIKSREELERISQSSNIVEAARRRRRRRGRGRRRRRSRSRSRRRR